MNKPKMPATAAKSPEVGGIIGTPAPLLEVDDAAEAPAVDECEPDELAFEVIDALEPVELPEAAELPDAVEDAPVDVAAAPPLRFEAPAVTETVTT